jgi:hypothetical protein
VTCVEGIDRKNWREIWVGRDRKDRAGHGWVDFDYAARKDVAFAEWVSSLTDQLPDKCTDIASLDVRPAIRREAQAVDAERGSSVVVAVVVMVDKRRQRFSTVGAGIGEDALSAGSNDVAVRAEQDAAAVICEVLAAAIKERTRGAGGAPVDDSVGAGCAAAWVDGSKVVVVAIPVVDE